MRCNSRHNLSKVMFIEIKARKSDIKRRVKTFGVGINDADYILEIRDSLNKRIECPFYSRWKAMIQRCYSKRLHKRFPTYIDCTVCDEWLTFSVFKSWMIKQNWKGNFLDKDILVQGNKIYSPETCIFIPQQINLLFIDSPSRRGKYKKGVCFNKTYKKYQANCGLNGKIKHIGLYDSEELAHKAYLEFKTKVVSNIANEQKEPLRSALLRYKLT